MLLILGEIFTCSFLYLIVIAGALLLGVIELLTKVASFSIIELLHLGFERLQPDFHLVRQCYSFNFLVLNETHYRHAHVLTCRDSEYLRSLHGTSIGENEPSRNNLNCDHNALNSYLQCSHSQF